MFDPVFEKKISQIRYVEKHPKIAKLKKSNNNQMKCFLGTMIVVNTKARNFMGIDGGPHKPQGRRNRGFWEGSRLILSEKIKVKHSPSKDLGLVVAPSNFSIFLRP